MEKIKTGDRAGKFQIAKVYIDRFPDLITDIMAAIERTELMSYEEETGAYWYVGISNFFDPIKEEETGNIPIYKVSCSIVDDKEKMTREITFKFNRANEATALVKSGRAEIICGLRL
jgi:hypothetical protein